MVRGTEHLLTTHGTTAAGRACHVRGPSSGTAGQHTGGTACHTSLAGAHGRDGHVEGTGRRGVYPESPHTGSVRLLSPAAATPWKV